MKRGGLGRGLDVLLPQSGELLETVESDERFVTALTPTGTGLLVAVKK